MCMKKDIFTYKFPGNLMKISKQMLEIWFNRLTGNDVDEYYQNVMETEWVVENLGSTSFFAS